MNFGRRLLLPILWLISVGSSPAAQIVLLPSADTSLWQRGTNHNLGGSDLLPVGTTGSDGGGKRGRPLLKFDVAAALPSNAVIESASFYFRVVIAPMEGGVTSTMEAFPVLFDWGEGNKTYTDPQRPMNSTQPATAGEATWLHRFHGDESQRWQEPGGALFDQDFSEDPSFSAFLQADAGRDYNRPLTASGLDVLRQWLTNPASNFGWVLISQREGTLFTGRQIASREFATPEFRPRLTINYSLPEPVAPQIQSITRAGVQVTVRFSAQANVVYRPQHRPLVHTGGWTDLPNLGPLATDGTLEFTDDLTGVNERYYQVIVP
jgi:hypothetical protein